MKKMFYVKKNLKNTEPYKEKTKSKKISNITKKTF